MQRKSAQDMSTILAALQEPGKEGENTAPLPGEEADILHAYPVTIDGIQGVLHTKEEIPPDYFSDTTVVESQEPNAPTTQPALPQKEPPYFLHFLLILMLFMLLDNMNSSFLAFLRPTATITIIPKTQAITLQSTTRLGKLLSPITI